MCISNLGTRRSYQASSINAFQKQAKAGSSDQEQQQANLLVLKDSGLPSWPRPEEVPEAASSDCSTSSRVSSEPKRQAQHHHITVVHNYHDHAHDSRADYQEEHPARGGVTIPFPIKLHEMLLTTAEEGMDHIVSWQPHGRCFLVHKPKEFVELLPRFFKLSKLASFQRQLNLYGFQRLTQGRDRGGYYHELFLKHRIFLSHSIQRIKVKGTGVRARSNPDQEPDFWGMPWVSTQPIDASEIPMPTPLATNFNLPTSVFDQHEKDENDVLDAFEKPFHYLDPFQPSAGNWTLCGVDALLEKEADDFFVDFEFDDSIVTKDIEDDGVFGDLLEEMIA